MTQQNNNTVEISKSSGAISSLFFLVLVAIIPESLYASAIKLPQNFLKPPVQSVCVFQNDLREGYSDSSKYYSYQHAAISGSLESYKSSSMKYSFHSDGIVLYSMDTDNPKPVKSKFFMDGVPIFCFAKDSVNFSAVIAIDSLRKPAWVDRVPESHSGEWYGIGVTNYYYNDLQSAWWKAERKALNSMILSWSTKVRKVVLNGKDADKTQTREFTSNTVNSEFKNIHVVERWIDPKTKLCWVLVSGSPVVK